MYDNEAASFLNVVSTGKEIPEMTTKDNFMQQVETYTTFKIATIIDTYWFPILVPIGLFGNTLSFLVMIKPNNRKMSTCIYMAAISINDNIMMSLCLHTLLIVGLKIQVWHHLQCKLVAVLVLFALQNTTLQVLAMTIDKYIAIKWPHMASAYSTPKRAKLIIAGLSIFALIYNSPHLLLTLVVEGQCFTFAVESPMTKIYSWFSFVLNAVVPFSMLIYMNCVIVKTVRNSRTMFGNKNTATGTTTNQGMETRQSTMKNAERQLTIMLLLVTTLFLILLCPTYIRFIHVAFVKRDTPLEYANSMFLYQITSKLYATNSGINFLLYCISGQKFRSDLKDILLCFNSSILARKMDVSQSITTENSFA